MTVRAIAIYSPIPVEPKMGAKIKYFLFSHTRQITVKT